MRIRNIIITSLTALALSATGPLLAQGGPGGGFGGPGGGFGGPGGGFGGHGAFAGGGLDRLEHMLPRLADYLELTDDQQSQIQAILDDELPAIHVLRDQIRDARELYMEGRDPGQFDEAQVRAFAESQASLHVEMAVASARTMSRVYNVLTPSQQDKLQDLRGLMGRHRSPRHGGGQMKP